MYSDFRTQTQVSTGTWLRNSGGHQRCHRYCFSVKIEKAYQTVNGTKAQSRSNSSFITGSNNSLLEILDFDEQLISVFLHIVKTVQKPQHSTNGVN